MFIMNRLNKYEIFTIISLAIVTILVVVLAINGFHSWCLDRKVRKSVRLQLNKIIKRGYSWAVIPKDGTVLHDTENNPYVSAKKESVQLIGTFPNGKSVYQTKSGDTFSYNGEKLDKVIIDAAENVYYDCVNIVESRLVLTDDDKILLNNFYIINDPQEAKDYRTFRACLLNYFYELDRGSTPCAKIDNDLIDCIGEPY